MLTIPWKSTGTTEPASLVQVSRLELAHIRDVPGFLIAALRIRAATLNSPGATGLSLRAAPLHRTFWTLSAWTDREAISAFVTSDIHTMMMMRYRDRMADSHFHTWTEMRPTDQPPEWDDALERSEPRRPADGS